MSRQLVENLTPSDWQEKGSHLGRVRWLQGVIDLVNRPVANRVTASTNATAVACNGSAQSSGVGTGAIQPRRYAEHTVKARVTFNLSAAGTLYIYIYRTTGNVPANGAAPNAGDVIVGGDSFAGPATVAGQNMSAAFSFLDTGLDVTKNYKYYLAVNGTNTLIANLVNSSQLLVMERA